jgi:hypothetical protein
MAYAFPGARALDYSPCHYGASRLMFRGPARALDKAYLACLGGSETYGKFVPRPFAARLEEALDLPVLNLGCMNAGPEVYVQDPVIAELAGTARACVMQITGAQNLTNRYYSVHPRRNDRFVAATPLLRAIYREVDFTEFNFTRHLLQALSRRSADRFEVIAEELRAAWVARMAEILGRIPCPTVLLWLGAAPPPFPGRRADLALEPMLVDAEMVAAVRPLATSYVEVIPSAATRRLGVEGMAFGTMEAPAAALLPGPAVHGEVAEQLVPVLRQLI